MFIQPCFIRKNTPELRDKLKKLGYRVCSCCEFKDNIWLHNFLMIKNDPSIHGIGVWDIEDSQEEALNLYITENANSLNPAIDCGENEEIFLALASLRNDSDYEQWFVNRRGNWYKCLYDKTKDWVLYTSGENWHKATVGEIIEHFKNKTIMNIPENMKEITNLASQLVKEESSAVNPILPQDNLFVNKGWQCPICGRVYSPFTHMCIYCGNKEVETIILPNIGGLPQEQKKVILEMVLKMIEFL